MQQKPQTGSEHFEGTASNKISPRSTKRETHGPWIHLLAGALTCIEFPHERPLTNHTGRFRSSVLSIELKAGALFPRAWPEPGRRGSCDCRQILRLWELQTPRADILGSAEDSAVVHAQAAICAGIATATATNPIWLVKTRLQLDKTQPLGGPPPRRYRNSIDCVRQVLRHEGFRGLYRGLSASYLGSIETALHLVLYERLKSTFRNSLEPAEGTRTALWDELTHWVSTSGAAGSAKFVASLVTYPHEVVRTRLRQAPVENGVPKYTGLVQCFRTIAKEEGMAGLYGGLTPHMLRSLPSAVITLGVYEFVLRVVGT